MFARKFMICTHFMLKLTSRILLLSLPALLSGCQADLLYETSAKLIPSVLSISAEASGPGGSVQEIRVLIDANRSWFADVRNPILASDSIDWVELPVCEAECASNRSFRKEISIIVHPNDNESSRVCELVFHAAKGEVIIPIKQKGVSL